MKYLEIKKVNSYINDGVIGQDIDLSIYQKIKLLFCKGISIALISPKVYKNQNK